MLFYSLFLFPEYCAGSSSCCGVDGYLCDVQEGDCDTDADCKPGLVCGSNNCPMRYGFLKDCCKEQE